MMWKEPYAPQGVSPERGAARQVGGMPNCAEMAAFVLGNCLLLFCAAGGINGRCDDWGTGKEGPFEPLHLSDQTIYNRLAQAATLTRWFLEQMSRWLTKGLPSRTAPGPFARQVLVLDDSTLDQMHLWLPELRQLGQSDPG